MFTTSDRETIETAFSQPDYYVVVGTPTGTEFSIYTVKEYKEKNKNSIPTKKYFHHGMKCDNPYCFRKCTMDVFRKGTPVLQYCDLHKIAAKKVLNHPNYTFYDRMLQDAGTLNSEETYKADLEDGSTIYVQLGAIAFQEYTNKIKEEELYKTSFWTAYLDGRQSNNENDYPSVWIEKK